MTPQKLTSFRDLETLREQIVGQRQANQTVVTICAGTGCLACGCELVATAFRQELKEGRLDNTVEVRITGCHGFCERGPLVVIQPDGIF